MSAGEAAGEPEGLEEGPGGGSEVRRPEGVAGPAAQQGARRGRPEGPGDQFAEAPRQRRRAADPRGVRRQEPDTPRPEAEGRGPRSRLPEPRSTKRGAEVDIEEIKLDAHLDADVKLPE
eukprot:10959560-Lingulodinium_polyedra.AAC.1